MTITALNLITDAAKLLGVVFKNEALSSDEANDGLVALNDMLDEWSNDDLMTYALTLENFSLTGASSYTIGSGGTFNTTRPINIATAVVRSGGIDYPLQIISDEQYQTDVALKSITTPIPQYLCYDNGYPLGTIKMYSIPSSGGTLYLQSNKPLTNIAALTTSIDLPPGWKKAIKNNLAIELAAQYGAEVPASVIENARKSKGAIKRSTAVNKPMPLLPEVRRGWNIFGGWS
jgi:hypothetical protein